MFYCEPCAKKKNWPFESFMLTSRKKCVAPKRFTDLGIRSMKPRKEHSNASWPDGEDNRVLC